VGCLKAKPPLRPALAYKSGASGQIIGQIFLAKKKGGTMWQERKINSKNLQKFEDGLLRVDACFRRHSLPRKFQYQFPSEDMSLSFGHSALWEERRLQNKVAILVSKGLKPAKHETLEEFVARHSEILEEVI
jgi:hypothetical protein